MSLFMVMLCFIGFVMSAKADLSTPSTNSAVQSEESDLQNAVSKYNEFDQCYVQVIKEYCQKMFDPCLEKALTEKEVRECGNKDDACWDKVESACKKANTTR